MHRPRRRSAEVAVLQELVEQAEEAGEAWAALGVGWMLGAEAAASTSMPDAAGLAAQMTYARSSTAAVGW